MPSVLAVFAHPDDIEFRAAGTLLLLRDRGWDVHYCNLSSGDLGSSVMSAKKTATVRSKEARQACHRLGFVWYPSISQDLQIFYTDKLIRRVCSLVRRVQPTILLTHPTSDYMEDHMETARIAVTAAFARSAPNYRTVPAQKAISSAMTIYHSTPHGLKGPMRQSICPELWVNTKTVHGRKREALACHASQKEWLDVSQGMDSCLEVMDIESALLGQMSGRFTEAEGWTRHLHLGFGAERDDPLSEALGSLCQQGSGKHRKQLP
ncbi:MAG: LmbE family protein [Pedosphaera sp.]|nr:LmbE family protein [Pedosphaera sp.]